MTEETRTVVEPRLLEVLGEVEAQTKVASSYAESFLPFVEEMRQIREYIEVAGEYGLAYETLVAAIEIHPFVLSGKAAISLLEVGLIFGFKTDREEDSFFDMRQSPIRTSGEPTGSQ
jgi:hypothetical protein